MGRFVEGVDRLQLASCPNALRIGLERTTPFM